MEKEKLEQLALDICYDRHECKRLGIDYNNVTHHDIQRIKYLLTSGFYGEIKNAKEMCSM